MSWLRLRNAEGTAEGKNGGCPLVSAFCSGGPPRIAPRFRGNLIRITRRLITAGAVSGWHTQAFPVDAAKQPQALHFFNTAGFSRSEKFAYNEYAASSE